MAQITAYRRDSGAKARIPEHWLDHKVLGAPYTRTKPAMPPAPSLEPADVPTPDPTPVPSPGPTGAPKPDQTPARGAKKNQES